MKHELALAAIRDGNLTAADAWKLVSPLIDTDDSTLALHLSNALRAWVWKALDRRRRDPGLREWIDLLNRVEGFLVDRFQTIAARIDVLVELLHESIAVASSTSPDDLLRRKHVTPILRVLDRQQGEWLDRAALMDEVGLKPANMTRLMTLLVDVGWAEQEINGREAKYRLSAEGIARARTLSAADSDPRVVLKRTAREYKEQFYAKTVAAYGVMLAVDDLVARPTFKQKIGRAKAEWEMVAGEAIDAFEIEQRDDDEELDDAIEFRPQPILIQVTC